VQGVSGGRRFDPKIEWICYAALVLLVFVLCYAGGRFKDIGQAPLLLFGRTFHSGYFILVFAATWAVCLALTLCFPRGLSRRRRFCAVFIPALACRLLLLPFPPSDDLNRYLWEGHLVQNGVDPYRHPPNDPALADLARKDPFHRDINHPDMPAIYPPLMLVGFSAVIRLGYTPLAIKIVMMLFDLGALFLLMRLLSHRQLDERWAILHAFNPVVLYAFAGQGHLDAIQNFFLLAALWLYDQRRWGWMFFAAGLAVQSKYVAILTLPFLLNRESFSWFWTMLPTVLLPFLPFLDGDGGLGRIFDALVGFGSQFAFNGPIHGFFRWVLGEIPPATGICQGILVGILILGYGCFHPRRTLRFHDDPATGCFFVLGALLLLSPTVHFWYIAWIVPFLALRPFASWMVLCLTISAVFMADGHQHFTGQWRLPGGASLAVWLPFWTLFALDVRRGLCRFKTPAWGLPPATVSVVIPAKNEGAAVAECVLAVLRDRSVLEAIVVDGGSEDNTVAEAVRAGARIICHAALPEMGGGRGGQVRAGVATAVGDVIAVVHADTRIVAPALTHIVGLLRRQPMIVGGAVGGRFDEQGWRLRLLEAANDFRAAFLGISFGDQVQFFRRGPIVATGGYPDMPLMEDVELSLRLQNLGRVVFLFGDAKISSRRWRRGVSRRAGRILCLFLTYLGPRLLGRRPDTFAMYQAYYNKDH